MAGTATSKPLTTPIGSVERQLIIEVNKIIDDLETLRAAVVLIAAQLDDDAGVTDTDYEANADLAAANLTAAKIQDEAGTEVTA